MYEHLIPWAAWHGDSSIALTFPAHWKIQTCPMRDAPGLSHWQIREAFRRTIGSATLREAVAGRRSVAIVVDDLSRPTPAHVLVPYMLEELLAGGILPENITFIIGLGSHTPLQPSELAKKLGEDIVAGYRVLNHDCCGDLTETDIRVGNVQVKLNSAFMAADFRILVGSVVPHAFAGFSGGAKMVLPGLSNIESIEWTHKAVLMGLRGRAGTLKDNRFRKEFERVARLAGTDFVVQVVVNSQREISGVFAGDLTAAHSAAADFAGQTYATMPPTESEVVVLNTYPKDDELLQAENALMFHHTAPSNYLKPDGVMLVTSACSLGMGHHGLFGPGQRLHREPRRKAFLGERLLVGFMPGVTPEEFHQVYWEGYPHFRRWEEARNFLEQRYPRGATVSIVPCSSIQIAAPNQNN